MPTFSQSSIATSSGPSFMTGSPAWTVTQTRSQSSFMCSSTNSRANSIAPSLKYWPNEKLPSISKNVRWWPSRPTSSMSTVRKHFCEVVVSGAGGGSRPRKNGLCGCIPAVGRSVESSPARGTSEYDGHRRWPRSSKNERKPSRSSAVVRISGFYERVRARPVALRGRRRFGLAVTRGSQLLVELALAARRRVLRDPDSLARVAPRPERGEAVRDARREAAHLLHRCRDRRRHGPDRGIGAIRHRDRAVGHDVQLVELIVDAVDGAPCLHDHRQEISLRPLDERGEPGERPAHADEQVEEPGPARDEERREGVVEDVAGGGREHGHPAGS